MHGIHFLCGKKLRYLLRWNSLPVICHVNLKLAILDSCGDKNGSSLHHVFDTVTNAVLHNRLHNQLRYRKIQCLLLRVHDDADSSAGNHLLQFEIVLHIGHFLPKRNLAVLSVDRHAVQTA